MRRAAVLGHPISHSLSPVLHRAAYTALGLDWEYSAVDVDSPQLADFVASCGPEWAGLSLTMPLKHTVLELCDHIEPLAEVVGAVNTLLFQRGPSRPVLVGANTDVYGIVTAIREGQSRLPDVQTSAQSAAELAAQPTAPRAVVLGAGATAASALAALGELGCHEPAVFVRSLARTGSLRRAATRMGVEPTFHLIESALDAVVAADIVISTAPAGAADGLAAQLLAHGKAGGSAHGVLLDVVYDPRPTPVAAAWSTTGGINVSGERMLLHQAGEQVRLMTSRDAPIAAMSAALDGALAGTGM